MRSVSRIEIEARLFVFTILGEMRQEGQLARAAAELRRALLPGSTGGLRLFMASMVSSSTRVTSQLNRSDEEVLSRHTLPLTAQRVVVNNYSLIPIITSVDLMIATTSSPCLRFRLSAEVRVMAETIS